MPAEMAVIKRVPIAQVGTWAASTGEWEATRLQFEDAVRASQDRSVRPARIYLGHNEERIAAGTDTTPAVGWPANLALDDDTLYADLWVPPLLADTAHVHFPGRSIEARTNVTAQSGQTYSMVIDGVALLGRDMPAVDTLPDLAELWGMNDREPVAASAGTEGSRLIVCALKGATPPASAGPDNPRQEAPMPSPAPAEDPKAPAPGPKATEPKGTDDTPKADPLGDEPSGTPKAEQPKADEPKADTPILPDGFIPVEQAKWDELNAKLAQLDTLMADKAEREADEFAGELVAAGKIAASSKPKIVEQFKANPDGTRAICDLLPDGAHEAPPTGRVAATRADDTDGDDIPSLITLTPAERKRLGQEA
jgi:hypothetical protein